MKNLESLTISDYISIFRRRIWYVAVTALLVSVGTVAYVLQLPSIYRSETTIAISNRFLPEDYIRSIDRQTNADRMEFVRQQLQSRAFLEGILGEFHLAGPDGMERASETIKNKIEITVVTASTFKLGFTATDSALAQSITKRLADKVIQLNDSSRKEKVQVADQFLGDQLRQAADELSQAEQKLAQFRNEAFPGMTSEVVSPDTLRDLQSQLSKLDGQLESARDGHKSLERRLQEHRQLQLVLKTPPPPQTHASVAPTSSVSVASPLETELANKRAQLAAALTRYTQLYPDVTRLNQEIAQLDLLVRQSQSAKASTLATPATQSKEDQRPVQPLSELDPSVDLLPAEIQLEMDQVDREIAKTEQAKHALSARISTYQARLNPAPTVAQDLGSLTRDYDAAKQRYTVLSDKRLTSEMAARADSSENNAMFKVIDTAFLPRKAVGPNRRMMALIGGMAGLVLGLGIAFLRDYMDSTLNTEEEVLSEIRVPVLGSIPSVAEQQPKTSDKSQSLTIVSMQGGADDLGKFSLRHVDAKIRDVIQNPLSVSGEHFRFLHTQLLALRRGRSLKSIIISSAVPNEGKTFSACCIAGILAQDHGKKVLLIDGDLRRSNATNMLGLGHRQLPHNLSSVLQGEAEIKHSVLRCDDLNLSFLPAGPASPNVAKALSSPQLERVLRESAEAFDWVIVDSPPILAAADVNLMAPFCDSMLLVIHSGKTPLKLIKDSIKRVGHDRICGVVMNRVSTIQSNYSYGSYYGQPPQKASKGLFRKRHDVDRVRES